MSNSISKPCELIRKYFRLLYSSLFNLYRKMFFHSLSEREVEAQVAACLHQSPLLSLQDVANIIMRPIQCVGCATPGLNTFSLHFILGTRTFKQYL